MLLPVLNTTPATVTSDDLAKVTYHNDLSTPTIAQIILAGCQSDRTCQWQGEPHSSQHHHYTHLQAKCQQVQWYLSRTYQLLRMILSDQWNLNCIQINVSQIQYKASIYGKLVLGKNKELFETRKQGKQKTRYHYTVQIHMQKGN